MNLPGACRKLHALKMPAGRHTPAAATPPKPTGCLHQFADPNPALWDLPARTPPHPPPPTRSRDARGEPETREPEEENPSPTAPALNHIRTRELRPDPRGTVRACQGLPPHIPGKLATWDRTPSPLPAHPAASTAREEAGCSSTELGRKTWERDRGGQS